MLSKRNLHNKVLLISCACMTLAACSNSNNDAVPAADPTGPGGGDGSGAPVMDEPVIDPAEPVFSVNLFDENAAQVDNSFFPLVPGTTSIFEGQNDEGAIETVITTVSHLTRVVAGVESTIVVDREYEDGELIEETFDWYAQDKDGNVWYMGEASTEYENGEAVSMAGSWEADLDIDGIGQSATAGIIMKAVPTVGDTYSHEIYVGVAEDGAEIAKLSADFTYLDGSMVTALQIREFNPLDTEGSEEFKYYRSNFGLIAEEDIDGGNRIELIEALDQRTPIINAQLFSQPTLINHRFLPLVPGDTYTYEVQTDEGLERIVVEVLDDTRLVAGILNRVVRDRVYLDDVLIEDTHDWFAQDDSGNVWYFGEDVDNYVYDESGTLLEINHDGAWETGVNNAQAGITMPAEPRIGDSYRQEYLLDEAEDVAAIVDSDVTIELRDGSTYITLKTRDWNPLDEEAGIEFKYYAEGVGLVREEDEDGEEQVDLVSRQTR